MSDELNVWREACYVENETFHAVNGTFENDPEAIQASAFALKAAAAVIRDYGDKRYQQAIADVVEWLRVQQHGRTSDNYPSYYARQIEQRFGKDA